MVTSDVEVIAAFHREQQQRVPMTVRVACWLGIAGFASYIFADLALVPGSMRPLLITRGLIVGTNLLVFLLSFTGFGKRHINALAVVSCLSMGIGVSFLTAMTGGAESRYHEALLLVLIGFSLLIPWGPLLAGITFAVNVGSYDIVLLATGLTHPVNTWVVNNFILWAGVVICTVGVLVSDRLRRIEFQSRFRLKATNEDLSEALDKLKELDRLKTRFFANVSHELRTPLTLIMGPLESLLERPLEQSDRHLMETMMTNARRLLRQVNTILDAAKLEAGRLRLKLEKGLPGEVLRELVTSARPHAEARQIHLSAAGLENLSEARIDKEKLEVIAANLLSNAIKFTPAGGQITIRSEQDDENYAFSVEDTGPGIPSDQLERIFERFYQMDGEKTRSQGGTGLGLALARELVHLHGGTLEVSSSVGKGSTFTVHLPREPRDLHEERRHQYRRREDQLAATRLETLTAAHYSNIKETGVLLSDVAASPLAIEATPLESMAAPGAPRILVVEDNPELRAFLVRMLSAEYKVCSAEDGIAGLQAAQRFTPHLVISDIMMPRMNGHELCQAIRQDPILGPIPVILVTAKSGSEALVEGLKVGADDYVTKPFDMRELRARIEAQLRARTLERRLSERESRLAALGQMVTAIVGDIRNPLTTVVGYADMTRLGILDGEDPGELVSQLKVLLKEAKRLQRMLEELREFASIGSLALQMVETPVRSFLDEALHLLGRELEQCQIRFDTAVDLPEDLVIPLDRERFHHVLENLITNARNALTNANGSIPSPQVWFKATVSEERLVIRVADNGPGIPDDLTGRLFEPFASSSGTKGAGLGLVTVRNLMVAHGGNVTVESRAPEGGAAFTLTLPCSAPRSEA